MLKPRPSCPCTLSENVLKRFVICHVDLSKISVTVTFSNATTNSLFIPMHDNLVKETRITGIWCHFKCIPAYLID